MSCQVSVTLPVNLSFSSIADTVVDGIIGTSFLVVKFPNAKDTIVYKGIGTVSNNLNLGFQSISTTRFLSHKRTVNSLIGPIIGNCVKLYLNGVLSTIENAVCLDDYITLKIPDSSDSEIVYQSYVTLKRFQGTLIFEYSYGNNNFTVQNIYFNLTVNNFYTLNFETISS